MYKRQSYDWSADGDVDPKLAAELKSLGIKSPDHLESLPSAERAKLDAHLSSKGVKWDWGSLGGWKTKAAAALGATGAAAAGLMGGAADKAGGLVSGLPSLKLPTFSGPSYDWSADGDVDPKLAAEFAAVGIKSPDHLASLSAEEATKLEAHLKGKGLKWDRGWLSGWKRDVAARNSASSVSEGALAGFSSSPSRRTIGFVGGATESGSGHSELGIADEQLTIDTLRLFEGKPKFKDDLTLLDGIDGPQAVAMQKMGIFNFDQLHGLSLQDRHRLQLVFRKRGWSLDMDQWRIASEGNTLHPSIEDIQKKAFGIYEARSRNHMSGGERTDWEQAEWELRGNPIFSYGVPHDVDDFAVSVTGVTADARDELYRMGVYNRHQLNSLDTDARRLLTRWFAGPRFGVDLTQSFGWLDSLTSIPSDRNFGHVFAIRPEHVDDLSDIQGVGGVTEHNLNRLGIYQFGQIIGWTEDNIRAISEVLNLGNRVADERWIEQARQLSHHG